MAWRILRVLGACGVLLALGAPACGGSSSETRASGGNPGSGGSAHAGSSSGGAGTLGRAGATNTGGSVSTAGSGAGPVPVSCGKTMCDGVVLPILNLPVPGCCADPKTAHCGLDTSALAMFGAMFSETCQPLAQPGTADPSCPNSAKAPVQGTPLEIQFPGCCRADHTCGYQLDKVAGVIQLGLGCVESTPFLDGGVAQTCGDIGAGGDGGAGGDPSSGGTASGGTASGGTASGGTASGGTASGGTASGGTASGGTASGGTASGGTATGGTATGGTATGGTGG